MKTETIERPAVAITPYREVVDARLQAIKDRERELERDGVADHYRKMFNKSVGDAASKGNVVAQIVFEAAHRDELTINCLRLLIEGDIKQAGYTLRDNVLNNSITVVLY
jgi:hypothetical protein